MYVCKYFIQKAMTWEGKDLNNLIHQLAEIIMGPPSTKNLFSQSRAVRLWASYQIRKIAGYACAGNAGKVFPHRRFPSVSHLHYSKLTPSPWKLYTNIFPKVGKLELKECWQTPELTIQISETGLQLQHDDITKWKHLPRYWHSVRGFAPQRRHRAHYDVTVMNQHHIIIVHDIQGRPMRITLEDIISSTPNIVCRLASIS